MSNNFLLDSELIYPFLMWKVDRPLSFTTVDPATEMCIEAHYVSGKLPVYSQNVLMDFSNFIYAVSKKKNWLLNTCETDFYIISQCQENKEEQKKKKKRKPQEDKNFMMCEVSIIPSMLPRVILYAICHRHRHTIRKMV